MESGAEAAQSTGEEQVALPATVKDETISDECSLKTEAASPPPLKAEELRPPPPPAAEEDACVIRPRRCMRLQKEGPVLISESDSCVAGNFIRPATR